MIEKKCLAFLHWQEDRRNVWKSKEYVDHYRKVRRAVNGDKEKWLNEILQVMEEDMRHHLPDVFKKMKQLPTAE